MMVWWKPWAALFPVLVYVAACAAEPETHEVRDAILASMMRRK